MKKKELIRFFITGCCGVLTDMTVYYLFKNYYTPTLSKAISFVSGVVLAYLLNKYWTFGVKEKSNKEIIRFATLYSCTLVVNVSINKTTLTIFPDFYFFAFLCSTGTSAVLNFIGLKWWVFKEKLVV